MGGPGCSAVAMQVRHEVACTRAVVLGLERFGFGTTWWVHVSVEAMDPRGPDPFDHCPPDVVEWSLADLFGLAHMVLCFHCALLAKMKYRLFSFS